MILLLQMFNCYYGVFSNLVKNSVFHVFFFLQQEKKNTCIKENFSLSDILVQLASKLVKNRVKVTRNQERCCAEVLKVYF